MDNTQSTTDGVKPTTRDHLLIIFAGVFAHPQTFGSVAQFVDDKVVGNDDPATVTLWRYLQLRCEDGTGEPPTLAEALVDLVRNDVDNAFAVVDQLRKLTSDASTSPRRTVALARKLSRSVVNRRRREHVRKAIDTGPLTQLDVETVAADAVRRYPHTNPSVRALSPTDCTAAVHVKYTVIPTGFSYVDKLFTGLIVGEYQLLPGRTGDGKSSVAYSFIRNQFFAHAAKHREDPFWDRFGSSWAGDGGRRRREVLLTPLHAGHGHATENYLPPRVLWFSLEEPVSQVLGRFYCDLLDVDRHAWTTQQTYREHICEGHADDIAKINNVLGSGRLTIIDYATRQPSAVDSGIDEEFVEQTLADVCKKARAWARECDRLDAIAGVQHPRLMLVDYAQLINVPDDQARQDHAVLAKVSTTLRYLAPATKSALLATVMLLRDHESNEPSKEQIKGSGQFGQDAARVLVLWPFGERERDLLRAVSEVAPATTPSDSPFDAAPDDDFESYPAPTDPTVPTGPSIVRHCRRAVHEMRVHCEKDRFGAPWRLPLTFNRKHARVTEALPDVDDSGNVILGDDKHPRFTSYREHAGVTAIIRPKRTKKDKGS